MNSAAYRTTELVGYLWPVAIYKQNIKKALPKHLTTIKHCGRLVKGVVLGSEHGWIPGVIKVEKVGTCEVSGWKALEVDDDVRKGGQQAVYDALQKNVTGVSATKRKKPADAPEDDPDTYALANPLKKQKKKAENGSDDDDEEPGALDALFGSIAAVKNTGCKATPKKKNRAGPMMRAVMRAATAKTMMMVLQTLPRLRRRSGDAKQKRTLLPPDPSHQTARTRSKS